MKYGVLVFSYSGSVVLDEQLKNNGHISINLGDYMQTLAVRNFYKKAGIADEDVVTVDRDTLSSYAGEPLVLIMNGCFFRRSFPLPDNITPVFIGFQAKEPIIVEFLDFFKRHEPIGCRDTTVEALFHKYGVKAYTTGCLTMTFDPRPSPPEREKIMLVYGSGVGDIPLEALQSMRPSMKRKVELVFQRKIIHSFPVSAQDMHDAENYASYLLNYYRDNASMVITPLHHAATPCMASGIPVSILRRKDDNRFSYLRSLLPVLTAPDFSAANWSPEAVDMTAIRRTLLERTETALDAALRQPR